MLSGGAALGIYHMGVVKSLWENGLLPHVISGSSAGSIVAAMLGTHSDEELREVMAHRESLVGLIKWNSPPRTHLFDVEHFNAKLFDVAIQTGAMLAVVWFYRARILAACVAGLIVLYGLSSGQIFLTIMFGLLAFQNIQTVRAMGSH